MKIALLDLNHFTRGVHTNTVPLGLGLISTYLQNTIAYPFDIKMFKDIEKCSHVFKVWLPDILGISQYSWNSELNLHVAKLIKKIKPDCLIVAGGPNLDLSNYRRADFFKKHGYIDVCVLYDGEIPFAEIAKRLLSSESIDQIRKNPVAGTYALDPYTGELIESVAPPPRLNTLDVFGTVYADGIFDEFLDDGFHPFVQTHRGCPFTCSFCHTSDSYYSRMLFLSPKIFRQDIEYLGKRFSGQHNVTLYIANTNMSLFKEDFPIAEIIRETQEKYDWPRLINVNSGKNPKKLLDMLSIIKFQPGIALQTLTPTVLKNIKRKNIPFGDFVTFQHEASRKTGETSSTELILCLPGETKESFIETLKTVMNSGVQNIVVYTLMNLKGTPLSTEENVKAYGSIIRHRVVPRQFSVVNETKILDTEEVVVGTNSMSYQDYIELRGLSFTINTFFSSTELIPLKRLLLEFKVDIARWLFCIHKRLPEFHDLYLNYKNFIKETEEELFLSREELLDYFDKPGNFEALRSGSRGDNLLRKYKCIVLFKNYKTYLELAFSEARKLMCEHIEYKTADSLLDNIYLFLSTRDMKQVFEKDGFPADKSFCLSYDVPLWLQNTDNLLTLENFHGSYNYIVKFSEDIKEKIHSIIKMNKDFELSLQILYRDGSIREFWPSWIRQNTYNVMCRE
jgi:radical SAM superfamily enzyme YgiQ (UPF0313 family)